MWELRWKRDSFSVLTGRIKGRKDPEWVADRPELCRGDAVYLVAFWDLDTERSSSGLSLGRIPWSRAWQYGIERLQFDRDVLLGFWRIVRKLDGAYLQWMKDEYERTSGKGKKGRKAKGKGRDYGR